MVFKLFDADRLARRYAAKSLDRYRQFQNNILVRILVRSSARSIMTVVLPSVHYFLLL
jgi:hypothetical protein